MYFLRLYSVSRFILRFFKSQNGYNGHFIDAYLQPFEQKFGRSIAPSALQKIKKYYCLGIPATCASYAAIYGRSLSPAEQELATLTGIITPLIDDFTDNKTLSTQALDALTSAPQQYIAHTLEEEIVKTILCHLLQKVPSPAGFLQALKNTIQAQHWSQRQMLPGVSRQELLAITLEKGAWSHIFFHYIINEVPTQATTDAMHLMGGMLQTSNDIFDIYKDYQEGIATYASTCPNYATFETYYLQHCRQFCSMARALPYPKKGLEFFITFMASVMGRGLVALQMLKQLQKNSGEGPLPLAAIARKSLICDMKKPANMVKTAWFTYKIVKR